MLIVCFIHQATSSSTGRIELEQGDSTIAWEDLSADSQQMNPSRFQHQDSRQITADR